LGSIEPIGSVPEDERKRIHVADSKWPQDRDDDVPDPAETDPPVHDPAETDGDDPDHRGRDEPGPGNRSWEFWAQQVIEKGLPFMIQLLTVWKLVHGDGG
jgi:hypothetical protein